MFVINFLRTDIGLDDQEGWVFRASVITASFNLTVEFAYIYFKCISTYW